MMVRKTWLLASALLFAPACGDDDPDSPAANDGGSDASGARPDGSTADAGGNIDSGLSIDASAPGADAAQDASTFDAGPAPLSVLGIWRDETYLAGGDIVITPTQWGAYTLTEYDNTTRTAITQDADGKYSKQVWTAITNGAFYQCTQDYGKDTIADAKATTMKADPNDLEHGCGAGGFYWSHFIPGIELSGSWKTSGDDFEIDSLTFGTYAVESFDNAGDKAVLSTGGGDAGTPSFSKLVWALATPTRVDYCVVATGLTTAQEAADSAATADVSLPTTGCNGGAWSSLTR